MGAFDRKELSTTSGTGVGTNAGVTVTLTGAANKVLTPLGIQCSGDAAALVTIESPANTILYKKRFAAAFTMSERFEPGDLLGVSGGNLLVKVSASTSNSEANIQGAFISG